jgi:hypothetical protein
LHQFLHEQIQELSMIDYNGHLEVHSSLLSVVLRDEAFPNPRQNLAV